MSMRGQKLRAILEDLDLLVLAGAGGIFYVRDTKGNAVGHYDLYEDMAFRLGSVESRLGLGRTDCLSWIEFYAELQEQGHIPKPVVVR